MAEVLPSIWKKETKSAPNGTEIEDRQLTVTGKDLKEVEKIFDKNWKK